MRGGPVNGVRVVVLGRRGSAARGRVGIRPVAVARCGRRRTSSFGKSVSRSWGERRPDHVFDELLASAGVVGLRGGAGVQREAELYHRSPRPRPNVSELYELLPHSTLVRNPTSNIEPLIEVQLNRDVLCLTLFDNFRDATNSQRERRFPPVFLSLRSPGRGLIHQGGLSMLTPAQLLAQNALFDTMSPADIEALSQRLIERKFGKHEVIFNKGETGASMYIIRSGAVEVFLPPDDESPRVILKDLHTGEYFGELSLFDDKPRSATVEAIEDDTALVELKRDDFTDHLSKSKPATLAILSELAERLRETNAMLSQRAAKDAVKEIEENLTWGQRLADKVAELNGSWAFILFLIGFTFMWAGVNLVLRHPFDAYPYVFFNLVLAVLVSLQGPLIVMSQNRQQLKDRAQAETDFRVNLKNEVGIETLLRDLASFRAETTRLLANLERGSVG